MERGYGRRGLFTSISSLLFSDRSEEKMKLALKKPKIMGVSIDKKDE
ncbi:hypothetical protein [Filifactor villosus]|uniref:Uncharacterized protein n=1 Tax=Filifactor villosus TaxID=29374 RepID=A0ABV9QKY3_9FIRM